MNYLIYSAILGLVHILVAATVSTLQRGLLWNVSPRDEPAPPLTPVGARLDRAMKNFLETFPIYVAAIVAVLVQGRSSPQIELGSQLYFFARVVYLPIYALGLPFVRTLTWGVSLVGIALLLCAAL